MPTIAYLANLFPAPTERYVVDEIETLRRRGVSVIPCSVRRAVPGSDPDSWATETLYLQPLRPKTILRSVWFALRNCARLQVFLRRILLQGRESPAKRIRALAHTFLGVYYAVTLERRQVQHIHVHHGYFGSWVAMVAARLLNIPFTMTLHGSDILLDPAYLDLKLELCQLCITISEYNRRYLLSHYPNANPAKIVVHRLGVDCGENCPSSFQVKRDPPSFIILTAGRLHPVKDHAFLLRACRDLKTRGVRFTCLIAGEGQERRRLEKMIREFDLATDVHLLGQVSHERMHDFYEMADLVVLTSRSEGIPLVLMEAMAHEKIVLAPHITAIPELVSHGETGFLYRPGSVEDFVSQVEMIHDNGFALGALRRAARVHVQQHFDQQTNLTAFCDRMIGTLGAAPASDNSASQETVYEDPVLQ